MAGRTDGGPSPVVVDGPPEVAPRITGSGRILLPLLAALLVAGFGIVTHDVPVTARNAVAPAEMMAVVGDLDETWAAYDAGGVLATLDPASFEYRIGGFTFRAASMRDVLGMHALYGVQLGVVDEVVWGAHDTYHVQRTARMTTGNDATGVRGVLVIELEAAGGNDWQVVAREWFGPMPRY